MIVKKSTIYGKSHKYNELTIVPKCLFDLPQLKKLFLAENPLYNPEDKEALTKLLKLAVNLHQKEGLDILVEIYNEMFRNDEYKLLEMTRFLISRKQYKLALFIIKQINTINPESMGAHVEYVTILRNLNQFQKAVDHCKNVIAIKPDNAHIKIELARILIYQRKYIEAAEQLSFAEKIDPDNEAGLLLQGRLWRAQKNVTKSIES